MPDECKIDLLICQGRKELFPASFALVDSQTFDRECVQLPVVAHLSVVRDSALGN